MSNNFHKIVLIDEDTVVGRGVSYVLQHELIQQTEVVKPSDLLLNTNSSAIISLNNARLLLVLILETGQASIARFQQIYDRFRDVPIIVMGRRGDHALFKHVRMSHSKGWLPHDCSRGELAKSIRAVIKGDDYFPVINMQEVEDKPAETPVSPMLTDREFEIFSMLAEGLNVHEVAERLFLSSKTVSNHRTNILNKLQLNNSAQLARLAIRHGVIDP